MLTSRWKVLVVSLRIGIYMESIYPPDAKILSYFSIGRPSLHHL